MVKLDKQKPNPSQRHALTRGHHSPGAAVCTSIQPAVLRLLDQHGDHLSLVEGQQGAVGASRLVGHPGSR